MRLHRADVSAGALESVFTEAFRDGRLDYDPTLCHMATDYLFVVAVSSATYLIEASAMMARGDLLVLVH